LTEIEKEEEDDVCNLFERLEVGGGNYIEYPLVSNGQKRAQNNSQAQIRHGEQATSTPRQSFLFENPRLALLSALGAIPCTICIMRLDPESSLYFSHFQFLSFSSDIFIKLGFALALSLGVYFNYILFRFCRSTSKNTIRKIPSPHSQSTALVPYKGESDSEELETVETESESPEDLDRETQRAHRVSFLHFLLFLLSILVKRFLPALKLPIEALTCITNISITLNAYCIFESIKKSYTISNFIFILCLCILFVDSILRLLLEEKLLSHDLLQRLIVFKFFSRLEDMFPILALFRSYYLEVSTGILVTMWLLNG